MSTKSKDIVGVAQESFKDKNHVAFLGPPNSGKTVVAVLMKDAIYKYYLSSHPDIKFNVVHGSTFLSNSEKNMFAQCVFPIKTPTNNPDEIVYDIYQENGIGPGIRLRIADMSGEDYESIFLGSDMSGERRLYHMITYAAKKTSLGPLAYAPFAKMYLVLVDCSEFDDWRAIQTRYSQLLNSIFNVKQELGKTSNGKFNTPFAVVLTKSDKLSDVETNAEELIKKYMPQFYEILNLKHAGNKGFFKLHIDLQPNEENIIDDKQSFPIKKPLSYSNVEYVNLIDWIIQNFSRS